MAPHQKCSRTCTRGSFASNYRAVKMCCYLTCASKTCKSSKKQGLVVKMDGLCRKQMLLRLPVYRAPTWPQRPDHRLPLSGTIWLTLHDKKYDHSFEMHDSVRRKGKKKTIQKNQWLASMRRNTNVFKLFVMVGVHFEILQFDFSPSIIIPFGKHNAICSQKNYTTVLQKTNNLLALCLTEQHCQSARNHPF